MTHPLISGSSGFLQRTPQEDWVAPLKDVRHRTFSLFSITCGLLIIDDRAGVSIQRIRPVARAFPRSRGGAPRRATRNARFAEEVFR